MDSVAFAFCDAVASALKEIPPLANANSAEWSLWKSAFADHYANRLNLRLRIGFEDGNCSYTLSKARSETYCISVDLEEVKKAHRKYVHLRFLTFGDYRYRAKSSLSEIRSILKFLRPFVGPSASLALHGIKAPREVIAELLSLFRSAPFWYIMLFEYEEAFEDFLKKQFKLDSLQEFEVYDYCPRALELEAEFERIQSERRV